MPHASQFHRDSATTTLIGTVASGSGAVVGAARALANLCGFGVINTYSRFGCSFDIELWSTLDFRLLIDFPVNNKRKLKMHVEGSAQWKPKRMRVLYSTRDRSA